MVLEIYTFGVNTYFEQILMKQSWGSESREEIILGAALWRHFSRSSARFAT